MASQKDASVQGSATAYHGATTEMLMVRARVVAAVRAYFTDQGFLEVETPARVANPGQELHLEAYPAGTSRTGQARYLVTSPEHHMKRLLARTARAGQTRLFQFARAFRAGEDGPHHQAEFTLLEWYRAGEHLDRVADDCAAILTVAARAAGAPMPPEPHRTTVRELVREYAGIELVGDESIEALRALLLRSQGGAFASAAATNTSWDDLFFQMFLDRVEPALAAMGPVFVFDWPLPLAALARRKPSNRAVVERFELYASGLELANAFGELLDPAEQRARFAAERDTRARLGKAVYPMDEALLEALPALPEPTSGAALGVDRLVMWATGVRDIRQVVAFPADEP